MRGFLGGLFPVPAGPAPRSRGVRLASAAVQAAVVLVATGVGLLRVPGVPAWDSMYWDDYGLFFVQALQHPWHLLTPDRGYVQVLPHLIAQVGAYLPLSWAAAWLAGAGALAASLCGLFVYHASAGHVRSVTLRALLGLAVVFGPVAPLEIDDSVLGVPWYMLMALFWAVLWRPRTWAGIITSALLALGVAASTSVAVFFAPLLALRVYALSSNALSSNALSSNAPPLSTPRRARDHAVTLGWVAGCLVQAPTVLSSYLGGQSPLDRAAPSSVGISLSFYAHDVVLPSLGWHVSWRLQSLAGRDGATVIVAVILAAFCTAVAIVAPRGRLVIAAALVLGFVYTVGTTTVYPIGSTAPPVSPSLEPGARYTTLPVFLIEAAIIVGVDCVLRRRAGGAATALAPRALVGVTLLIAVLAVSWIPDFRYQDMYRVTHSTSWWSVRVSQWRHDCEASRTGVITEHSMPNIPQQQVFPCARLNF